MTLTLTLWEIKHGSRPSRGAQERMDDPSETDFDAGVAKLIASVVLPSKPFQIVAQMGDSSRGFQLGQGWTDAQIKSELWKNYRSLIGVNG